jgi:adenosylmethionine-8-amino-7-oxononanoate aminotransferase
VTPALIQNRIGAQLPHVASASGVWLTDVTGKRYLDGCSGAVVASIGHNHPAVLAAINAQAQQVTFVHRGFFSSRQLEDAAHALCDWTGLSGAWFVNSGSEAVEAAMQFALQYHRERGDTARQQFLSLDHGYHGNTLGGLSLSGHARRAVAGDLAWPFPVLPVPHRGPADAGTTDAEFCQRLLTTTRRIVAQSADTVAGIVAEPVGGATLGATVPPDGYLPGLRDLCTEFGILLITDEVMSGLGRTGTPLATDHWGVTADIVAVGKGLGAGYTPIAATLVSKPILDTIAAGTGYIHGGHTYAGNPFSAAIALAVLRVFRDEDVVARGAAASRRLRSALNALTRDHPIISDVRGKGMLLGIELAAAPDATPGTLANELRDEAMEAGLLLYTTTGGFVDALLIAPPLTIDEAEIDDLIERLDRALHAVEANTSATVART